MYDRRPGFFREEMPPAPGRRVDATVKWFNASKGFGFVTMSDGTQDAFLPMAILRRAGYDDVREGSSITCEVGAGAKGPLVTNVLEHRRRAPPSRRRRSERVRPPAPAPVADARRRGQMVRARKGLRLHLARWRRQGRVRPHHRAAPQRLNVLGPGQRVRVEVVEGKKGLEADRIALLSD